MAHDPKDFFRRSPEEGPSHVERVAPERAPPRNEAPTETVVGSTDYKAYGVMAGGCTDCDVRYWKALRLDLPEGVMFDYRLLSMIQYSALDLEGVLWEVDLMFPDCIIRLVGQHLQDLRYQLRRRRVSFIQEYSPMVHTTPLAKLPDGEPVVTKIHVMQYGDLLREREAQNKRPI